MQLFFFVCGGGFNFQSGVTNQCKDLFLVFISESGITNQGENFFLCSSKFETRIHVINISVALDQNQLLNAALELKCLPISALLGYGFRAIVLTNKSINS